MTGPVLHGPFVNGPYDLGLGCCKPTLILNFQKARESMAELTPMKRQYFEIKEQYKDCLLFYRLGEDRKSVV